MAYALLVAVGSAALILGLVVHIIRLSPDG
jgi:hypothetical protein